MKATTNALDNMVTRVMSRTDVFVSRESCRAWIERYYEREGCYPNIARPDGELYTTIYVYRNWNDKQVALVG